jgi:hypothetical protein
MTNRRLIAAVLIAFVLGWWWASSGPQPWSPHKDRPALTWIMRTAKRLLWIAIVADPPPAEAEPRAQALVGEDGFRVVEHRRGW